MGVCACAPIWGGTCGLNKLVEVAEPEKALLPQVGAYREPGRVVHAEPGHRLDSPGHRTGDQILAASFLDGLFDRGERVVCVVDEVPVIVIVTPVEAAHATLSAGWRRFAT
jgi:hypothetical protein